MRDDLGGFRIQPTRGRERLAGTYGALVGSDCGQYGIVALKCAMDLNGCCGGVQELLFMPGWGSASAEIEVTINKISGFFPNFLVIP